MLSKAASLVLRKAFITSKQIAIPGLRNVSNATTLANCKAFITNMRIANAVLSQAAWLAFCKAFITAMPTASTSMVDCNANNASNVSMQMQGY